MAEAQTNEPQATLSDALKSKGQEPMRDPVTVEAKVEETEAKVDITPSDSKVVETKTEGTPDAGIAAALAPKVEVNPLEEKVAGLTAALRAERQRRQEAEQYRQSQELGFEQQQTDTNSVESLKKEFDNKFLFMSETSARTAHPDYDEKFGAFYNAIYTEGVLTNPSLYKTVMSSDHPGEAAYQAGKSLLVQKKYGVDWDSQYSNVRKELEAELRPQIRSEIEAEFQGKVIDKQKQPFNLLGSRNGGGGGNAPFAATSLKDLLRR